MFFTRNHLEAGKQEEVPATIGVKQGDHLVTPPPLAFGLLGV